MVGALANYLEILASLFLLAIEFKSKQSIYPRVMYLDQFWSKPAGKMPHKELSRNKDIQAASRQDGNANDKASLEAEPRLTKALEVLKANIAIMINGKVRKDGT